VIRDDAQAQVSRASLARAGAISPARENGVRAACDADIPDLIALINALADERNLLFITAIEGATGAASLLAHLAEIAENHNEAVFVAAEGGQLVGLATAIRGIHPARRGVIDIGIGVHADHRRNGIGRALMMAAEDRARRAAIERMQLTVVTTNAPAIALYRAMGFVVEGTLRASARIEGRSVDQYMMAKLLATASR
jgi:ribosomal protein S18 acetylase RimI-like enzyme